MDADSLISAAVQVPPQAGTDRQARRRRRWWLALLFALLPVSVWLAIVVLNAMASAFADPTGGCGGG